GVTGTGSPRVTISSDNSDIPVKLQPQTSGGTTPYSYITSGAANQDSANVKGSAGQPDSRSVVNTTATGKYVKLYDQSSAPTSADTPKVRIYVPANGGANLDYGHGVAFANGIGHRATSGAADADTGALASNDVFINLTYK